MPSPATLSTIKRVVRDSLRLSPSEEIPDTAPLAGGRHDLDSLDMLLVVTTLEKEFGIKIMDRSFDRSVFTSLTTLAEFIEARKVAAEAARRASSELVARLPHRAPFLFVSSITDIEAGVRGAGEWHVQADADFLKGHFPGEPIVPGVLITEALAQLAGLVAFANMPGLPRARLARTDMKFVSAVSAPATITLRAVKSSELGLLHVLEVTAESGGTVVASGTLTLALSGVA